MNPDKMETVSPSSEMLNNSARTAAYLKLILCSGFGIALFLLPLNVDGNWTIVLAIFTNTIVSWLSEQLAWFTVPLFVLGGTISALYNVLPRAIVVRLPLFERFQSSHWIWTLLAILGAIFAVCTFLQAGPEWIIGAKTGGTAYIDVAGPIFLLIGFGCLFLPFLSDYGLLEFVGTLLQKPYQKLFNLPGRATIDTLASWVGSSSIAVLMTGHQYEKGYYTGRQAATICTNFSVVSIPFVVLISQVAGLAEYFFQLYMAMIVICVVCAVITPRLPPLKWISDDYYGLAGKQITEDVHPDHSRFSWALNQSLLVASRAHDPMTSLKKGFSSMVDIFLMMMPAAMTIEFITLAVYNHTPIFQFMAYPLVPLLDLLQIPESNIAAPGLFIGIFDQFVPAIMAGESNSLITKFVLAGLSVTQVIFFAETALLILRSQIPLSVGQLVAIFCIRTLIALPMLAVIAHWIF
jgi:nucleoside recognition membrane protein YjiH